MKVASEASLRRLMERSFSEQDVLAVYIDGIEVCGHHVLAAVGLDRGGEKHLLGLVRGSSENAHVVKDLLDSLVKRGIDASVQRLFVIDGSKAIRSAIEQVYGEQALVQRCRAHKLRNVSERLPEPMRAQLKSVMHAAYNFHTRKASPNSGSRPSGCKRSIRTRSESARGAGGDLHGQSAQTHSGAHALPVYHQHHRESQWSGAPCHSQNMPLA